MLKLSIMTEQELNQIFGTLDSLIPLHEGEFTCSSSHEYEEKKKKYCKNKKRARVYGAKL